MKFVDSFLEKFKKVDESDRDRLRTQRQHMPEHDDVDDLVNHGENTSMGSFKKTRTAASKSMVRLKAFAKGKTIEEVIEEDARKQQEALDFTNNAISDMGQK